MIALSAVDSPSPEDIDILIEALGPRPKPEKPSNRIFSSAAEAYWKIGTVESLPKLVELMSRGLSNEQTLIIVSLSARFPARSLQPFAPAIRKAMHQSAQAWQDTQKPKERLLELAVKLATTDFLRDWASSYGADGLERMRGSVCTAMLNELDQASEAVAQCLLVLAQWRQNVTPESRVVRGLKDAVLAGHGRLIAASVLRQQSEGHKHLIQSGLLFLLYPSMREAVAVTCQAIQARADLRDQRVAGTVALGLLVASSQQLGTGEMDGMSFDLLTQRTSRLQKSEYQEELQAMVDRFDGGHRDEDPVSLVAHLACSSPSSTAAASVIETWLRPDDCLSRYAIRCFIRAAGLAPGDADTAPTLERLEHYILDPANGQSVLRQSLEHALVGEVMIDGHINQYAIDVMQNIAFDRGANLALSGLNQKSDADFLFSRLMRQGRSGLAAMTKALGFHRDGDEDLTAYVQASAIACSVKLLPANEEHDAAERFAQELHKRFQDLLPVREAAYLACGTLARFSSIRPLKERLQKETSVAPRDTIKKALGLLRDALIQSKPQHADAREIETWLHYVADLGDAALLPQVVGYLRPPHADHSVRQGALNALATMGGAAVLDVVVRFMEDTAPEGATLTAARRARLALEERKDVELFEVLAVFYDADAAVVDPGIQYEQLLGGSLLFSVTRNLKKAQRLWVNGHWDEFITQMNSILEALVRQVFRTKYSVMGIDQQAAEKQAGGSSYMSMINLTQFRTTYGKLQAHCNTIHSFRRESPTAHAMNRDGTSKIEATEAEAHYVRSEFLSGFSEAVAALKP